MFDVDPVPANSTRYFNNRDEALAEPFGLLHLEVLNSTHTQRYLINSFYDQQKIKYDELYNTESQFHVEDSWKNIKSIFQGLSDSFRKIQVIEIGCGQGEIITRLNSFGIRSIGFDPVLTDSNDHLLKQYFTGESLRNSKNYDHKTQHVFVLRCVLPHISSPMTFIDDLFEEFPSCFIYIEFQNLNEILKSQSWYSFMHDHVNYFTQDSFSDYNILLSGEFAAQSWVLISNQKQTKDSRKFTNVFQKNKNVQAGTSTQDWSIILADARATVKQRNLSLKRLSQIVGERSLLVYGAAGKGTNFSFAAVASGDFVSISAVDASASKTGRFMECSGVEILSLEAVNKLDLSNTVLAILNKEHESYARNKIKGVGFVTTLPLIE